MSSALPSAYKFGGFSLLPADKQLIYDGKPLPLPPKAFDTLLLLVQNQGHLLEKDVFLKQVWPDSFVEEVALAHSISQVRKVLRSAVSDADFIETVPTRGYRFVAAVAVVAERSFEGASRVTLAVLPFENLGADLDREYLADGLTEEVIAALGQVDPEHFGVIGRTSMMAYKRTTKSLTEIGAALGAEFLVESSLRAEGRRLRIMSRLIRARDQMQLWSASFDREPPSVLEFQRELSAAIAHQVGVRLSPDRMSALERRQPRHVEAYDLYLRGRYFWNQLSPLTTRRAIDFYIQAIALDPDYALAWSGLTMAYAGSPINGDAPPLQVWPRAREAAAHAVRTAPNLAETQIALGVLKFWLDWDWTGAEAACRRAVALDASSGLAHRMLGVVLSALARHEDALVAMRRARELDPFDFTHYALSAQVAFTARDYLTAVECSRQASLLNPEFWVAHYQLGQAYERLGQYDAALDALQRAALFSSGNSKVIALRGYVMAKRGRTRDTRELLHTLEGISRERYVPSYAFALLYAGLGEPEPALEWLERAYDAHDVHIVLLVVDPKWDVFRSDTRFQALIERCRFTGDAGLDLAGRTGS
jgi:TolB-like protein/tetratricopeptide (TPR) repeat protein